MDAGDSKQALDLLVAARDAGFDVSLVTVGSCRIEVRAPVAAPSADDAAPRDPREAIYQKFGGEFFRRAVGGGRSSEPSVPGADLQPAIEVDQ